MTANSKPNSAQAALDALATAVNTTDCTTTLTVEPDDGSAGPDVATNELMFLHVDIALDRVVPIPAQHRQLLMTFAAEHAALPRPDTAGCRITTAGTG